MTRPRDPAYPPVGGRGLVVHPDDIVVIRTAPDAEPIVVHGRVIAVARKQEDFRRPPENTGLPPVDTPKTPQAREPVKILDSRPPKGAE